MRAAALVALLLAGCAGGPGATPSPATPAATAAPTTAAVTAAPATPTASASTTEVTAPPTATPVTNTVYTADDEEIAKLIKAGAAEAIPQLKLLNDMGPDKLTDLFVPLGVWITSQKAGVQAYTPSSCTTAALALFIEGMDRYDDMRKKFLAWRDWGAHGHAFPAGSPREAHATFGEALVELEAHCPA
jgi:hypothetical protein